MAKHPKMTAASRQARKNGAKPRRGRYEIVGKTSDGITILRGRAKATHFTRKQIREAILAVVGAKD